MNPIKIITASAGSGKTYRLAEELSEAVISGEVRPEAIIATTFTVKAASELRQRVRARLLTSGHHREASRLAAARFGTVHAVCGQLINDFAFELGLPPELGVLDEDASDLALKRVLSEVMTKEESDLAAWLLSAFGEWDWQSDVRKLVSMARSNGLTAGDLEVCADRCRESYLSVFGDPLPEGTDLERKLLEAIEEFLEEFPEIGDTGKGTAKSVEELRRIARILRIGGSLSWKNWAKLASLGIGAKCREAIEPVHEVASQHDRHPRLRRDVAEAIGLVYTLAARTMETYRTYKLAHGMIDFVDQEAYALQLLQKEDIQHCLAPYLDLVLVDEFQDTSPIQLAIFLQLASMAKRSVWVGDQKQAVFGFRGTDPALIDAVIEKVCRGRDPETLPQSWRSRPELVQLTSSLFAPPFAEMGIPPERVVLEPGREEPEDLGHILEHWTLDSRNQGNDALALSDAVSQFLDDDVPIRDNESGEVRSVRPGDVAILCRRNDTCTSITHALESRGIRVVLPRPGLLSTLEGRVLHVALRLWVDPEDTLAEAELAYLTEYPGDGDEWLRRAVVARGDHAFRENPLVQAVLSSKEGRPGASPVDAVDTILEATGILELCHRWGKTAPRLANVERFRAHAVVYQQSRLSSGSAATTAGLILYLSDIAGSKTDHQGEAAGTDAVTVSTWHRAKGLEWPVTVLFELGWSRKGPKSLGIHPDSELDTLDLEDPLRGRWVRYWPNPYGDRIPSGVPMVERLGAHDEERRAVERFRCEELRVLYVGWTRARDRLVLASRAGGLTEGILDLLRCERSDGLTEPVSDEVTWGGETLPIKMRTAGPEQGEAVPPEPEPMLLCHEPRDYPPAVIRPSGISEIGQVAEPIILGDPIPIQGKPAWNHLGNAIHGFFAADRADYSTELRLTIALRLLEGWEVAQSLQPKDLLEMSDRLEYWIETQWPGVRRFREMPLEVVQENGSRLVGVVDLVLETEEGLVLIDHKSFTGTREQAAGEAAKYHGQLDAYRRMLEAETGKPVVATMIHCPVSGIILPLIG